MVDDFTKTSLCSSKNRWRNHITMCTPICSALQLFLPNGQKNMRTWWQINRIYLLKTTKLVLLAPKAWEEVISASCLWLRRCKPRFSLSSSPSVRAPTTPASTRDTFLAASRVQVARQLWLGGLKARSAVLMKYCRLTKRNARQEMQNQSSYPEIYRKMVAR
jgi:hypothetical protein